MRRAPLALVAAAFAIPCPYVLGQASLRSQMRPITAPIRHAGVYHLGTGTWTRDAELATLAGPDTIYNNTCSGVYYGTMNSGGNEKWQHRSCVPSPSHPTVPTIVPGATGNDEAPGCHPQYTINGFQFAYCSSATTTVDWELEAANSYLYCSSADLVPNATLIVTGLPGGTSTC